MDANRDGFIDEADLKAIHNDLGRNPSDKELKEMLKECPGQLNFTAFLTLFGEKMHGICQLCLGQCTKKHVTFLRPWLLLLPGTDSESTFRQAFEQFDPEKKGKLPEE